jgi:hypothetical protein
MSDVIDLSRVSDAELTSLIGPKDAEKGIEAPAKPAPGAIDLKRADDATLSRIVGQPQPISAWESLGRGAVEGATFGFDDELGFDKNRREESRRQNPWTHFAGEMVGSIAPMVASGGIATGLKAASAATKAVPVVANALSGISKGVEAVMLPGKIDGLGGAMIQGAKLGAVQGGLSGMGHADVKETDTAAEALDKRFSGLGKGATVGTIVGPVAGAIGHGVGRAAQGVMASRAAAAAETENVTAGSLKAIARSMERDRISPDDIIQQIVKEFPDDTATAGAKRFWGNRQPWTSDQVEDVVRRAINGDSANDIATALQANGKGPGAKAVQTLLDELAERHLGPLNLVDRAGLVRTGSGDNTQMTLRAAAATPGEARSIAREQLLERQIGAQARMQNAFEKVIGSSDFDGVAARHEAALQAAETAAYAAARANQQPFDLNPVINKWTGLYNGKRGPIPESVMEAVDAFVEKVPIQNLTTGQITGYQLKPPATLQEFIDARQNLLAVAMKHSPGVPKNRMIALSDDRISPQSRQIMRMRGELSSEVRATNPDWGFANDLARDGRGAADAMESGAKQALRLNAQSRNNLVDFTSGRDAERAGKQALKAAKTPAEVQKAQAQITAGQAQQNLFRVGLVRALNDALANKQMTHDVTSMLRLPAARKILNEILGPDDASKLFKVVDAEHAMLRTYQSQFGSQTTPLREAIDDLDWAPRFRSAWELLNPKVALAAAGEFVAKKWNADRNAKMMPMLTETDPTKQLDLLRSLKGVSASRQIGEDAVRRPAIAGSGSASNVAAAELLPKPERPKPLTVQQQQRLSQAREAIRQGAPRIRVIERLRAMGVDPSGI